jgi:hypothetical protein
LPVRPRNADPPALALSQHNELCNLEVLEDWEPCLRKPDDGS